MSWFIIEFVVVWALIAGFMATHSLAAAIVVDVPALATMAWFGWRGIDDPTLWLVAVAPLVASMLGATLGRHLRARNRALEQEKAPTRGTDHSQRAPVTAAPSGPAASIR